jgi:SAM-dependent methyltransferase
MLVYGGGMSHAHAHPESPTAQHAGHSEHAAHAAHAAADLPALLDLDAEVLGAYLPAATAWVAEHVDGVRTVVDLGAGTGVGARALAEQFGEATVVALERAPAMLERLEGIRAGALAGRLEVVDVDLDAPWPVMAPADLVWAASSLHEVTDPARVLAQARDLLRPGGVVVVVEMDSLPCFLPDDVGSGLEVRCHAALAAAGWNAVPDWAPVLTGAGLEVVARRQFPVRVGPGATRGEEYARATLAHQRRALDGVLAAADLAALDHLLADHGPDAVLAGDRLTVRGSRVAWLARRP